MTRFKNARELEAAAKQLCLDYLNANRKSAGYKPAKSVSAPYWRMYAPLWRGKALRRENHQ